MGAVSDELELAGRFGVIRNEASDEKWVATTPLTFDAPADFDATLGLKKFGMQGNAEYGNCFWAALVHSTMLQALTGFDGGPIYAKGFKAPASDAGVKWYEVYERSQGQSTAPPGNGTGIFTGVASIAKQGLALWAGVVKGPFTPALIRQAIYDFDGGAIFCLALDPKAQQEFNDHEPWGTLSTNPDVQDGHAVPGGSYSPNGVTFVTWAALEPSTDEFDLNCIDGLVLVITHGFILKHGAQAAQALASKWGLTEVPAKEGVMGEIEEKVEAELEEVKEEVRGLLEGASEASSAAPEADSGAVSVAEVAQEVETPADLRGDIWKAFDLAHKGAATPVILQVLQDIIKAYS